MIALCFKNHSRPGLAADGGGGRQIRAIIRGVDQAISELSQKLRLDSAIHLLGKITASNPTLVRDDYKLVTFLFEPAQSGSRLRIHLHLARIAAVIDVPHESPVAVEKDSRPALVRRAGHFRNWR